MEDKWGAMNGRKIGALHMRLWWKLLVMLWSPVWVKHDLRGLPSFRSALHRRPSQREKKDTFWKSSIRFDLREFGPLATPLWFRFIGFHLIFDERIVILFNSGIFLVHLWTTKQNHKLQKKILKGSEKLHNNCSCWINHYILWVMFLPAKPLLRIIVSFCFPCVFFINFFYSRSVETVSFS